MTLFTVEITLYIQFYLVIYKKYTDIKILYFFTAIQYDRKKIYCILSYRIIRYCTKITVSTIPYRMYRTDCTVPTVLYQPYRINHTVPTVPYRTDRTVPTVPYRPYRIIFLQLLVPFSQN